MLALALDQTINTSKVGLTSSTIVKQKVFHGDPIFK